MRFCLFFLLLVSVCGQDAKLERARIVNLERAGALPNFVVDEKATRYKSSHTDPPKWELFDTVESEISVRGKGFERQNVRRNGKPWKKPNLSDFNWGIQFGWKLRSLFSPDCSTEIEFEGKDEQARQPLAYRFHSPQDGCFGYFTVASLFTSKSFNPVRRGRFLIDDPGGNVIYFEEAASEYPKGFGLDPWKVTESWDYVKIGDAAHLLPVAAEIFGGFTKGDLWHVVVEFKNHRHFEASTNVTFQ